MKWKWWRRASIVPRPPEKCNHGLPGHPAAPTIISLSEKRKLLQSPKNEEKEKKKKERKREKERNIFQLRKDNKEKKKKELVN